jgi:beta-glucanase (GH16 family)
LLLRGTVGGALLLAITASTMPVDPHVGERLSLAGYEVTFDEPFDRLDVSPHGPGTRWTAHTPWNGDFGDATFIDPRANAPFRIVSGMLRIEMRHRGDRWETGLLSAADSQSRGFVQSGGYFEIRAKLPGGPGVWPAFWLGSNGADGKPNPEIDVIEYYGKFPEAYLATTHVWDHGKSASGTTYRVAVPKNALENAFHLFGVSIDEHNVIFYLDRKEVAREATRPEYLEPVYPMIDLGAGGGWPIAGMPDPSIMYVDYIRVYRRTPAGASVKN